MQKLEFTNDQNEARNKVLKTPLFKLVHETWRCFDEEIVSPVSLKEDDIVRYVLWSVENIKGSDEDIFVSTKDLRRSVVNLLRESKCPSEAIKSLSNYICAYVLIFLDCAFMSSYRKDIYNLCSIAENSIKEDYKKDVLKAKDRIKNSILQVGLKSDLCEWCCEHLLNDVFFTDEDSDWAEAIQSDNNSISENTLKSHTFEMTAEGWVNRYEQTITSLYKEKHYLIDKINKLRDSYNEGIKKPTFNRTGFIRDNIFHPKVPWLSDPYNFPAEAIKDLFNDEKFSDQTVSKAKKQKKGGKRVGK